MLNNNFTTPEQSKRLLELGVPADSADCYLHKDISRNDWEVDILKRDYKYQSNICRAYTDYLPCWSVGRLIEVITICSTSTYTRLLFSRIDDHTNIENLIHYISAEIDNGHIDFSKLEE